MSNLRAVLAVAAALVLSYGHAGQAGEAGRAGQAGSRTIAERWIATWSTATVVRPAPAAPAQSTANAPPAVAPVPPAGQGRGGAAAQAITFNNQTLRQIVHTSIGGDRVRVVFSNVFGTSALTVGAAHIAVPVKEGVIGANSGRPLTFSGRTTTTIPPGAVMISDAADLRVAPLSDLAIDLYLPTDLSQVPLTAHASAIQTNYVSQTGNHAGAPEMPAVTTTRSWFFLTRVEVANPTSPGAIVMFGDSITDGTASTVGANARWPDQVARRLSAAGRHMAVLNAAIAGNRILTDGGTPNFGVNALARFDRDVLAQSGATCVVVLEGINDFGMARATPTPTAEDVIAGHRQLIARARARGLKIIGATLTPFQGAAYFTPEGEAKRQAFNQWMRTGREYDAVIDFDAVVRDPKEPAKFRADYHSGDNLHPSDLGYRAMGDAVDLALFAATRR